VTTVDQQSSGHTVRPTERRVSLRVETGDSRVDIDKQEIPSARALRARTRYISIGTWRLSPLVSRILEIDDDEFDAIVRVSVHGIFSNLYSLG